MSITIVKAILYGNTAKHFGAKRESDGHTHQWKIFLRSLKNEHLSVFISRVQFRLHETYPNNLRVLHHPPFELEESGWGEFDVQIGIFFVDPTEKPVIFYHHLKLFSPDPDVLCGKAMLINEYYDELVFQDPSEFLLQRLENPVYLSSSSDEETYLKKKVETRAKIRHTRQRLRDEIQELTERLRITHENLHRLRQNSLVVSPNTPTE